MFGWLRKQKNSTPRQDNEIRETLFGDKSIKEWGSHTGGPWDHFAQAKFQWENGQKKEAIAALNRVIEMPSLESRHYLQAWHFLRQLGQYPPEEKAKKVLGIVVEVPMQGDWDLLAAYADHSARYYNFAGGGIIMDAPDEEIVGIIDNLLKAATVVVSIIGPWGKSRPPAPPAGYLRLNFLTPSGLHFGQGPFDVMCREPLAEPVFILATALMQALIRKADDKK